MAHLLCIPVQEQLAEQGHPLCNHSKASNVTLVSFGTDIGGT